MSATMTMTMSPPPPPPTTTTTMTATGTTTTTSAATTAACCPSCGSSFPDLPPLHESHAALLRAQRQIADLQAQVRLLNEKAAAAVDRWADYEDELSRLRAASVTTNRTDNTHTNTASTSSVNGIALAAAAAAAAAVAPTGAGGAGSSPRSSFLPSAARLSQLLSPRRSLANLTGAGNRNSGSPSAPAPTSPQSSPTPLKPLPHPHPNAYPHSPQTPGGLSQAAHITRATSPLSNQYQYHQHQHDRASIDQQTTTSELEAALRRERELRRAAEGRLNDTSREVEELSTALFEQANEMVATERRARAQLEQRVALLESRDEEKRGRLDRLEGALGRIESVRVLLAGGGGGGG